VPAGSWTTIGGHRLQGETMMESAGHARVFVHCRRNKRVPLFVALDRVLRQGWDRNDAFAVMRSTWEPDATCQAFIDRALAQGTR
jgi:hypothetical protein